MRNVTLGKKGSLFDYIDLIPEIFVGAVITLVAIYFFSNLGSTDVFNLSPEGQAIGSQLNDQTVKT